MSKQSVKSNAVEEKEAEKVVDLGKYAAGEGTKKLDQDQMLGIGGGTIFHEIIDCDGTCIEHIAMPVLLRERPIVKNLLKSHAQTLIDIQNEITNAKTEDMESGAVAEKLEELEERDINILLKTAFYCFKRVDAKMKNMDEAAGVEHIEGWIDVKQLRSIPEIAMGLNRFTPWTGTARR